MDIERYGDMVWKLPSKSKDHREIVGSHGSNLSIPIRLLATRVTFMLIIMRQTTVPYEDAVAHIVAGKTCMLRILKDCNEQSLCKD